MLGIDIINDFRSLLNESPDEVTLSKEDLLKILDSYEEDLEEDRFGAEGNAARISHYYSGVREYKRQIHETNLEVYREANQTGQSAMRSVFLMNGGAAIAISAFIGTIASSEKSSVSVEDLAFPLALFSAGTLFAAISFGATYLTQFSRGYPNEDNKWKNRIAIMFNIIAIFSGLVGLVAFGGGLLSSYTAMLS